MRTSVTRRRKEKCSLVLFSFASFNFPRLETLPEKLMIERSWSPILDAYLSYTTRKGNFFIRSLLGALFASVKRVNKIMKGYYPHVRAPWLALCSVHIHVLFDSPRLALPLASSARKWAHDSCPEKARSRVRPEALLEALLNEAELLLPLYMQASFWGSKTHSRFVVFQKRVLFRPDQWRGGSSTAFDIQI